jgi:hypothetical protein
MPDIINEQSTQSSLGDTTSKFQTAYKLNEYFQDLIVFADQKANFIISLSLGLLTGNLAIIAYNIQSIDKLINSFQFFDGVVITSYLALITAIIVLQWLIFNRAVSVVSPNTKRASKKTSIFFFGEVASLNHEDFMKKFNNKNEGEVLEDLVYQVYDKACIAKYKFDTISKSTLSLKILLVLTIIHPFVNIVINIF